MANLKSTLNLRDKGAEYWERSPKWRRVALAVFFIAICYALPYLNNPLLNTPGSDFQSVLFYPVGMYVLMAIGLNIVVGKSGLLDLGYVAFFAGGLMAGAAAFFYILVYENTSFKVGFFLGISAFTAAVLGGIGNLKGALFGGFALGLMETWTSAVFGTAWKAVISFIILVLVLLIKPTGLFGESIQQARV